MDNDIKKAEEKLEYLSGDPVTQELYFERERALHEKANLISTGLRKGREEGRAEGRAQGIIEGRIEGREEGREEGRIEEQIKMIKNMVNNGFDYNIISNVTGLSVEEIERLMNL